MLVVARAGLEPGTAGLHLRVRHPDHLATMPPDPSVDSPKHS